MLSKTNVLKLLNNSKQWHIWRGHVFQLVNNVMRTFLCSYTTHIPSFTKYTLSKFLKPDLLLLMKEHERHTAMGVESMKGASGQPFWVWILHPPKQISSTHWASLPSSVKWEHCLPCKLYENSVNECVYSSRRRIQAQSRSTLVGRPRGDH